VLLPYPFQDLPFLISGPDVGAWPNIWTRNQKWKK